MNLDSRREAASRSSRTVLDELRGIVDEGSLTEIPSRLRPLDPIGFGDGVEYKVQLASALETSLFDESVSSFLGMIGRHKVVIVCFDFSFLGGTLGVVAGERIYQAFELASNLGLPVLSWVRTGGARMQEGALGFMQMARLASAIERHRKAGLLSICYLDNPSTGGVFASLGSLSGKIIARPGALVGFAGPRVVQATIGRKLDPASQRSETLQICGLVDEVCEPQELRGLLLGMLDEEVRTVPHRFSLPESDEADIGIWGGLVEGLRAGEGVVLDHPSNSWETVVWSRLPHRVSVDQLARAIDPGAEPYIPSISGSVGAYTLKLGSMVIALIGLRADANLRVVPKDLALLRRAALSLAGSVDAVVFALDTYGAELSETSEQQGFAREIGRCLSTQLSLSVPTVTLLSGQGSGGASMALMASDVVLATEDSWLAPLSPEAAAAVISKVLDSGEKAADYQKIGSRWLLDYGIVDSVIPVRMSGDVTLTASRISDALVKAVGIAQLGRGLFRHVRLAEMNRKVLEAKVDGE